MGYEEMKERATDEQSRVELRSEKVRNIIGQVPPFLIRWGNVILIVIALMLAIAYWVIIYL